MSCLGTFWHFVGQVLIYLCSPVSVMSVFVHFKQRHELTFGTSIFHFRINKNEEKNTSIMPLFNLGLQEVDTVDEDNHICSLSANRLAGPFLRSAIKTHLRNWAKTPKI